MMPSLNTAAPPEGTHRDWLPFLDWMKAAGMAIIIYGHSGGHAIIGNPVAPFNAKQLGVAFFFFVLGFSLARERRPRWRVLYNRLFAVCLFGISSALLISGIALFFDGNLRESNYLPYFFGLNILLNDFPANQTTWYFGTYFHFLLLWAVVLRGFRVQLWMLLPAMVFEILTRAWLMALIGDHTAYISLVNWLTVMLLGMYIGQSENATRPVGNLTVVGASLALVALVIGWSQVTTYLGITQLNPYGRVPMENPNLELLVTSACISGLYLAHTMFAYLIARGLPGLAMVNFFARNTLIVVIVHMPLISLLHPDLHTFYHFAFGRADTPLRMVCNLLIYFVLLSFVSEWLYRVVRPRELREYVWTQLSRRWA